jgi:membrane-associated phospholipid phosphatase
MYTPAYTPEAFRPTGGASGHGRSPERPGAGLALLVAGASALGLLLVWAAASQIPAARVKDALALHDLTQLNDRSIESTGNFLLHLLEPRLFVIWGAAILAVALARRQPRLAIALAGAMMLAPFTADILKPTLAHPHAQVYDDGIGAASWPSGHAAAALTLVLCAVFAAPRRVRPVVAVLGAAYALATGMALLILAWHMPSDVAGGYLVAALWVALAVAAVRASERRWPPRSG